MAVAQSARRPLKSRDTRWAAWLASRLAGAGVGPNAISLCSILFAALGAAGLLLAGAAAGWPRALLLVGVAAAVQLRLLSNMLDGMVAVEGGRATRAGEVYNDAPDRVADILFLVAAGYALPDPLWGPALGWLAALLAVLTAYVRLLGAAAGLPADFRGPMAKPHRMAVLTIGCLLAAVESLLSDGTAYALWASLAVIALGSAATAARRLSRLVAALRAT